MSARFAIALSIFMVLLVAACCRVKPVNNPACDARADEGTVMAILYQQRAAEYKALCYQAYNIATAQLKETFKNNKNHDSLAVITDLDETALDNSAFAAREYLHGTLPTGADWEKWCSVAKAGAVPGSVQFFKTADSLKFHIFYISNRDVSDIAVTMHNMDSLGFPQIERSHFLFKTGSMASKQPRRDSVIAMHYKIVLLLGDNLIDENAGYDGQPPAVRDSLVNSMKAKWGSQYIVFPNADYGDWENAIYHFRSDLNIQQRDSIRRSYLKPADF